MPKPATRLLCFSLLAGVCFWPLSHKGQGWKGIDDFPGTARDDGVSFRIGEKAYCGTGLEVGWTPTRDFYAYELANGSWSSIPSLPPGNERQYASAFSGAGEGYVFGGSDGSEYLKDLWAYDPQRKEWTAKSQLPSKGRSGAASFQIGLTAYIIGGKHDGKDALREVWAYDILEDNWERKEDLPFTGRWRASACAMNGKGYLLFGKDAQGNYHRSLHRYDPATDEWERSTSFPGIGRTYAKLRPLHGKLIIVGGMDSSGTIKGDSWSYNPRTSTWKELAPLPSGGRRGGFCFKSCSTIHYSAGLDTNSTRSKAAWKNEHPGGRPRRETTGGFSCYPNPVRGTLTLLFAPNIPAGKGKILLYDSQGKRVRDLRINCRRMRISMKGMSKGLYWIRYEGPERTSVKQVVKKGN
ncbi:MAG: kelch repeat-containing protein [Flavobacteriales bacterium]